MSKLKNYCKIIPGYAFKSSDFNNGNSKVIKIADIEEHIDCSQLGTVYSVSKDIDKYKVQNGDFVMSMTSATQIGKIGIVENVVTNTYINQRLCKFSDFSNEVEPLYIYYAITQPQFNKFIRDSADSKSLQQNISHNTIGEYPIVLPHIVIQKRIAKTLSIIDSKISNNNRINSELEAMAKTIYDYWFTQFDFPDENGKPYRSSGGKMVWNDELKREIPEGWEANRFASILEILKDGTHNPPQRVENGIALLTGTMFGETFLDYSKATYVTEKDYSAIHSQYQPVEGDIIITKIGTLGNVNYLRKHDIPLTIHCNSALLHFNANYNKAFSLFLCKSELFQNRLKAVKGQSIQEFVSLEKIGNILIEIPTVNIVKKYNDIVYPMLKKMINVSIENQQLASLRDWLLPMLMNGQVGFKEDDT